MDYFAQYYKLMCKARNRGWTKKSAPCYVERHHFLPKSMGGDNSSDNLICLTAKEHYVAHHLLTKFTKGKYKSKMCLAFFNMSHMGKYRKLISSKEYQRLKQEFIKLGHFNRNVVNGNNVMVNSPKWSNPSSTNESRAIWSLAGDCYNIYKEDPSKGDTVISRELGYARYRSFASIVTLLREGWNPLEDKKWLEFKETNTFDLSVLQIVKPKRPVNYKGLHVDWNAKRTNKLVWDMADRMYEVFVDYPEIGVPNLSKEIVYKSSPKHLDPVLRKLRKGWVPNEDPEWLKFKQEYKDGV